MKTMQFVKYLVIYIVVKVKLTESKLEALSEEQGKLRYSLTKCVLSAAKEFQYQDLISMSLTTKDYSKYTNATTATDTVLLEALYKQSEWTVVITKSNVPDLPSKFYKKPDNYIIQFRHNDEFLQILDFLISRRSWNPHAKFIVLTSTIFSDAIPIVAPIVESLWKVRVLNAIILMPQKTNSSKITVYSWFPYSSTHCGDGFDETDVVNICKNGKFLNDSLLFPNKVSNDMDGCPVKVRTVVWPPFVIAPAKIPDRTDVNLTKGIEVLLMNTIAKQANFKAVYSISEKEQNWGTINKDKAATGMMKALIDEEVDVGLGALATLYYRHRYFDTSVTYHQESITWCVPHALPQPKWKCLLIIFRKSTWVALYICYIIVSLCINFLNGKYSRRNHTADGFQNVYSIMLGITIPSLPKATTTRLTLIFWILVCLILNALYHSSLISFLTKPSFELQIESLEGMVDAGFNFGVVPPSFLFMQNAENSILNQLSLESCDDVKVCLDRTAFQRDFAVGVPRMYMIYAAINYVSKTGENLIHWTKDDIVSYPIEMIMVKGCPLLARINQIIFRIVEAGLLSKWTEEFLSKPSIINKNANSDHHRSFDGYGADVILTIHHLEGAFIILMIGLAISGIVFILEVIYYKYYGYKYVLRYYP